jgi:hypothetical protein
LADVIFPAFYFAYIARIFFPVAGIAGLLTEVGVFCVFYRAERVGRLLVLVVVANVTSSALGLALASVLPSGLNPAYEQSRTGPGRAATWSQLATMSWGVALLVSIVVEYLVLTGMTWKRRLPRLGRTVVVANVASYVVLIAVYWLSVWVAHV